jgi:hypothetical protein
MIEIACDSPTKVPTLPPCSFFLIHSATFHLLSFVNGPAITFSPSSAKTELILCCCLLLLRHRTSEVPTHPTWLPLGPKTTSRLKARCKLFQSLQSGEQELTVATVRVHPSRSPFLLAHGRLASLYREIPSRPRDSSTPFSTKIVIGRNAPPTRFICRRSRMRLSGSTSTGSARAMLDLSERPS